jgi:hypothetical protein
VLFEILGKKNLISQSRCQLRDPKKSSTDILVPKKWSGTACYSFRNISRIFEFLKKNQELCNIRNFSNNSGISRTYRNFEIL